MSWSQSDVDALDTALKENRLQVQFGDRSVRYRSVDEMLKVRALAVRQVSQEIARGRGESVHYSKVEFPG